jgi:predicted DNA binding protein
MLSKETRLALIRARAKTICGSGPIGFLIVSKGEIEETINEVVNPLVRRENDDAIQEEEETGFVPTFSFDNVKEEKSEEDLLTPKEREILRADLARLAIAS